MFFGGNFIEFINLQEDLVKIYKWATEKNMMFNGGKFQVLRYGCTKDSNDPEYKARNRGLHSSP